MAYEFITYEKKGRIAVVTINRPNVMNALHPPAQQELSAAWDDFAADPDCWVAIVTGAGERAFCAGLDLKYAAQHGFASTRTGHGGFGGLTARFDLFKPVIAAVNGVAIGGGFEIALAADIIVAADHATFGLREPRVGLAALAGGMQHLPQCIPSKIAMGLMLTGKPLAADEAHRLGLVNEVVPRSVLSVAAQRWADEILECSPTAVRATKQVVTRSQGVPTETAMSESYPLVKEMLRSDDLREGMAAFAEKRQPAWKGK